MKPTDFQSRRTAVWALMLAVALTGSMACSDDDVHEPDTGT